MAKDDDAAAKRHALALDLEPKAGDGSFVRTFVAVYLVLLGVVAAIVLVADPFALFGTGFVEPVIWVDRDVKASAYLALKQPPDSIVMGSSRVMKLNPAAVADVSGLTTFNFSVNSAMAEDYLAVYRFSRAHGGNGKPRLLILGVDPEAFHNVEPVDARLMGSRHLRELAGVPLKSPLEKATDLVAEQSFSSGVLGLVHGLGTKKTPPITTFAPDGFLTYVAWEQEMRAGTFDQEKHFRDSFDSYKGRFAGFTKLSEERTRLFDTLLAEAKRDGVTIEAFVTPFHPRLEAALRDTTWPARNADVRALLLERQSRGLLRFHELSTVDAFGGDLVGWFDGAHTTEENSTRMIRAIFQPSATRAVQ